MIKRMVRHPKALAGIILVHAVPWVAIELYVSRPEVLTGVRLGFLIGLASYPIHHLTYTLSFAQGIDKALLGISLSFLNKIVIVSVSGLVLWGFWRVNLLYFMPPVFFSLLALSFFALYFAKQNTSFTKEDSKHD